jgi:murein DD-endopeptidase MepM/ murein hydrolase activator NlpD
MLSFAKLLCARRVPQMATLALISFGFAGCSADMSSRFSQNPFSNPFASQADATGTVQPPATEPPRQLPQYARPQSSYPAISAPQSYPAASSGVSGGGRGLASYAPPAQPRLETTATVAPRSVVAAHVPAATGGTTIIVGTSDTLEILARRYNVTPAAILAANGYKGPRALSPGQQLIIPHPTTAVAAAPAAAAAKPVAVATAAPGVHFVNQGESLISIARQNHMSAAELAKANGLNASAPLKLGTKLTIPAGKAAQARGPAAGVQQLASAPASSGKLTAAGLQQSARLAQAAPTAEEKEDAEAPVKASEATGALPTFRWPVRGKVITSYGAKTNGKANDGINLAVPEGTPIKAAEDGVVAYAGNELKGYGNLVLVRHANGYVTAYAHASELLVKRGDPIKRGQVIAKSGQSGEVGSPQLHFEIRKGSTPVDPLQFLNGA